MSQYRSIRDAVWACDVISGRAKLVALRLVEHWPRIFPSLASLVKFTGLSERTVREALRELEERNVIQTQHRPGSSSTYSFVGVSIPALGTPAESAGPPRQNPPDPPAESAGPTPAESAPKADPDLKQLPKQETQAGSFARPALMYKFPKGWNPKDPRHRDEGKMLGLTSQEVQRHAFECRNKDYPHGFSNADDQFSRELSWAARDKETRNFKANPHGLDEKPGRFRKPNDPRPPTVFGAITARRPG